MHVQGRCLIDSPGNPLTDYSFLREDHFRHERYQKRFLAEAKKVIFV